MAHLNSEQQDVINGLNYGFVGTLMPDGSPQVSPVWVETDGTHVYFSTVPGRLKERNLQRDARVALAVLDKNDPENRQVLIRGRVVEITADGAVDQINRLSKSYTGIDTYPMLKEGQLRVQVKILPEHVGGYT
jgi:PPOX class probable F420-dependent enzyme